MREMKDKKNIWIRILVPALCGLCIVLAVIFFLREKTEKVTEIDGFTLLDEKNPNLGITLKEKGLTVDAAGIYTGKYVEDGSDAPIQNVLALLVTNHSEEMLQIADLELKANDKDTVMFRITNIPANGTVLVLEQNRYVAEKGVQLVKTAEATSYLEESSLHEDKFTVKGSDGRLTLENQSEEAYPYLYVYYKSKNKDKIYIGGITYRVPFESVPARTAVESDAGHFLEDGSEVTNIQILENKE